MDIDFVEIFEVINAGFSAEILAAATVAFLTGVIIARFLDSWLGRLFVALLGVLLLIKIVFLNGDWFQFWTKNLTVLYSWHLLIPLSGILGFIIGLRPRQR